MSRICTHINDSSSLKNWDSVAYKESFHDESMTNAAGMPTQNTFLKMNQRQIYHIIAYGYTNRTLIIDQWHKLFIKQHASLSIHHS